MTVGLVQEKRENIFVVNIYSTVIYEYGMIRGIVVVLVIVNDEIIIATEIKPT